MPNLMRPLSFTCAWGSTRKDATQQVRGVALLPHGLGKKVRVLVFAQGEAERLPRKPAPISSAAMI